MRGKTKRNLILTSIMIILLLISFVTFKPENDNSSKELIKRVIETAVVYGKIPDYSLIKDKKNIIISSEIIDSNLLPVLPNIKLIVLSPTEIKKKANKEGDFLYLNFRKIDIDNLNAKLTLDNTWAVSDNSKVDYLSGGGMTIKFYNLFGKWFQKKSIEIWVS
ncbi:hypothetical protein [Clostridium sp.]|uniref:hypothetical protein n=1 Tax=Clostridium sp. TaxID=1506 RepID=UPI002FC74D0D